MKAFYKSKLLNNITSSSKVLLNEGDGSRVSGLGFGYSYTLDNREKGINPIGGTFLKFSQDLLSVSGSSLVETTFKIGRETSFRMKTLEYPQFLKLGSVGFLDNKNTRVTDRFFLGNNVFRDLGQGAWGRAKLMEQLSMMHWAATTLLWHDLRRGFLRTSGRVWN